MARASRGFLRMESHRDCTAASKVSGSATLFSFSVVRGPINPFFDPPYAPALVELDVVAGVRLVTQIVDCEFAGIRCGMPLDLCFRELQPRGHAAFIAPVFRPRR